LVASGCKNRELVIFKRNNHVVQSKAGGPDSEEVKAEAAVLRGSGRIFQFSMMSTSFPPRYEICFWPFIALGIFEED